MAQNNDKRILVACYSATGTTAQVAAKLADITGGEFYAITPAEPYTSADLDWHDRQSRSSVEMNDPKSRPALAGKKTDMDDYDVVFIGYPIWWDEAPRVINSFIETHNLKGKTLAAFATSGGSDIDNSVKMLKSVYLELNWSEGKLLNHAGEAVIRQWTDRVIAGSKQRKTTELSLIFPAEHLAPATSNTGEVHLSLLQNDSRMMITHFHFSPGSRNYWHYHPDAEQILLVLDGKGFYQEEGTPKRLIKKGDVIVSSADVRHWNGATPDQPLICLTVTEHSDKDHVIQMRPVTEKEYNRQ